MINVNKIPSSLSQTFSSLQPIILNFTLSFPGRMDSAWEPSNNKMLYLPPPTNEAYLASPPNFFSFFLLSYFFPHGSLCFVFKGLIADEKFGFKHLLL
jgi:hypothetical protein